MSGGNNKEQPFIIIENYVTYKPNDTLIRSRPDGSSEQVVSKLVGRQPVKLMENALPYRSTVYLRNVTPRSRATQLKELRKETDPNVFD